MPLTVIRHLSACWLMLILKQMEHCWKKIHKSHAEKWKDCWYVSSSQNTTFEALPGALWARVSSSGPKWPLLPCGGHLSAQSSTCTCLAGQPGQFWIAIKCWALNYHGNTSCTKRLPVPSGAKLGCSGEHHTLPQPPWEASPRAVEASYGAFSLEVRSMNLLIPSPPK